MKVILSPRARDYVRSEVDYLQARNPQAARDFVENLKRLKEHLSTFPNIGRISEELPIPGVFRFVLGSYLIDYEVHPATVVILAIRHGHQRQPTVPLDDDIDLEEP
ncbi:plasmid stabilization protein ParE [Rhizobium sp. ACO-34A]|nr:type II toxin-antitoxin system RelE/ParE family toxin [Rhizobium sp. ACO-34A]ATN35169.1 plasmid stabilization protein ParE [Rhizobium sp. ACO-34A]